MGSGIGAGVGLVAGILLDRIALGLALGAGVGLVVGTTATSAMRVPAHRRRAAVASSLALLAIGAVVIATVLIG